MCIEGEAIIPKIQQDVIAREYLPAVRALAALQKGYTEKAKEELASADRYELNVNITSVNSFYGALYSSLRTR